MLGLKVLAGYLAIGILLNYGSIFFIWGKLYKICDGNHWKYSKLYKKYTQQAIDFTPGFPIWAKFIFTQIIWPMNVYNTLNCGIRAIKEAKADDQRD